MDKTPEKEKLEVKQAIKQEQPKELLYYSITIEATAPVTLEYSILSESPEEALEQVIKQLHAKLSRAPKVHFHGIKKKKASVYLRGTNNVKLIKNF